MKRVTDGTVMQSPCQCLLDISSGFPRIQIVLVHDIVIAINVAVWITLHIAVVERVCRVEFVAEGIVRHAYLGENKTTPVYLFAHPLVEYTPHEQAILISAISIRT